MNKKVISVLLVMVVSVFLMSMHSLMATDTPDEVTINNEGYEPDKKGPVTFEHNKHVTEHGIACTECHHEYKDGKNVWKEGGPVKECIECHNPVKEEGEEVINLKAAFHKNCTGCHKAMAKDGKITKEELKALKKCSSCHQKKS